jgi:acetyl esterase/lipase
MIVSRRLRTVLLTVVALFVLVGVSWALDWAPAYWVAIKVAYRHAPLPDAQVARNLAYDPSAPDDDKRRLDLFLPAQRPFRTVVFFHGGGWTTGDRGLVVGGADVYGNIGRFLAARGYAVAVASYRLAPQVDWRTQLGDAARAVAWVGRHIEARGGSRRDLVLMGHSAGAQLATRLALDPAWLAEAGAEVVVRGVAAISGAGYDMDDEETYRLGNDPMYYARRFGAATPQGAWRRDGSPLHVPLAGPPPFLVASAEGDSPSLRRQTQLLAAALEGAGGRVTRVLVPGSSHQRLVLQLSRDDQTVGPAVVAFLAELGAHPAAPSR